MKPDTIKLFTVSNQMLERELDTIEKTYKIDLGRYLRTEPLKDEDYYPQFAEAIRWEATSMAGYYEVFYCLERSIRQLIRESLSAEFGVNWWDQKVPEPVKGNVEKNIQRERDAGMTMRSTEKIDYTTFGELGEIVKGNWQTFSDTFNSQKAFEKVMSSLNLLRGPIAHCCPLAEDEVLRLRLALRDWFRLME